MHCCVILPWAADLDGDGDVDDDDFAVFKQCYKGSGNEPNSYGGGRGWIADLDCDGDVDGSDYVLFAHCYNGPGHPPRDANAPSVVLGTMVTSRVGNPYFFTGRLLDVFDIRDGGTPYRFTDDYAALTFYDYRARTMLPNWGRFGQQDPFGVEVAISLLPRGEERWLRPHPVDQYFGGSNLYDYAQSSPLLNVDPSGKVVPVAIIAAVKAWVLANAACILAQGGASAFYTRNAGNDKYRHCHASCAISRSCSRPPAFLVGYFRELSDQIAHWLGLDEEGFNWADVLANTEGRECAGSWETYIPIISIGSWLRESCDCCCKKIYPPRWEK